MEKIDNLLDVIENYSDNKIQYMLRNVESDIIKNIMYFHPEEFGKYIQHNMSSRSYSLMENDVEVMERPTDKDMVDSIDNLIGYLNGEFKDGWNSFMEQHNNEEVEYMKKYNLTESEVMIDEKEREQTK